MKVLLLLLLLLLLFVIHINNIKTKTSSFLRERVNRMMSLKYLSWREKFLGRMWGMGARVGGKKIDGEGDGEGEGEGEGLEDGGRNQEKRRAFRCRKCATPWHRDLGALNIYKKF